MVASKTRLNTSSVNTKLVRVFVLQIIAISLATILGVMAAGWIAERVLIKEALMGEADYYWSRYALDTSASLPDTHNLQSYLITPNQAPELPEWLADQPDGFHKLKRDDAKDSLVLISSRGDARLFLLFNEAQVSQLALFFGLGPLAAVLLGIYLLTWAGYVMSRRAVSTLVALAERVRNYDLKTGEFEPLKASDFGGLEEGEVQTLVTAFNELISRMQASILRERHFTRNASHELRTPLAVIKANLDLLERFDQPDKKAAVVARMRRTVDGMEDLVETLLLLARDAEAALESSTVVVNDLLADLLDELGQALAKPEVSYAIEADGVLEVDAPSRLLSIVFTNLIRNAMIYTDEGEISVVIDRRGVVVQDTGCGIGENEIERMLEPFVRGHDRTNEGHGLGLAIVQRVCRRFGWDLRIQSDLDVGTQVRIEFPRAYFHPFSS